MRELTKIQREVYDFVVSFRGDKGVPPTRGEICEHFGWVSLNAADQHLKLIEKKGYLRLLRGKRARGIVVEGRRPKRVQRETNVLNERPTHQFE